MKFDQTHYEHLYLHQSGRSAIHQLTKATANMSMEYTQQALDEHHLALIRGINPSDPASIGFYRVMDLCSKLVLAERIADSLENPYSIQEFLAEDTFRRYLMHNRKEHPGSIPAMAHVSFHVQAHVRAGCRVYSMTPDLGNCFLDTWLTGPTTDDLVLPYASTYFQIPAELGLTIYEPGDGSTHPLVGMYVTQDGEHKSPDRMLRVLLVGGTPKNSPHVYDYAYWFYRVALPPNTKLDDVIMQAESTFEEGHVRSNWQPSCRMLFNALMYATHCNRGRQVAANSSYAKLAKRLKKATGSKRNKIKGEMRKHTPEFRRVLGETYVHRAPQDEYGTVKCKSTGRKLQRLTLVPAHIKQVAYGKRHSKREERRIGQYYKGPRDNPFSEVMEVVKKHVIK